MSVNSTKDKEAKISRKSEEWVLEITEEQYQTAKAKGIEEEALFKPGRHVFRRREPKKVLSKKQTTVVLHLDEKTFAYFQNRAQESENNSVELEINAELRSLAEKEAA